MCVTRCNYGPVCRLAAAIPNLTAAPRSPEAGRAIRPRVAVHPVFFSDESIVVAGLPPQNFSPLPEKGDRRGRGEEFPGVKRGEKRWPITK